MTLDELHLVLARRLLATIIVMSLEQLPNMAASPTTEALTDITNRLNVRYDPNSTLGVIVDRVCGEIDKMPEDLTDEDVDAVSGLFLDAHSPVSGSIAQISSAMAHLVATSFAYINETIMPEAETIARQVNDALMKNTMFAPDGPKLSRTYERFDWGVLNNATFVSGILSEAANRTTMDLGGTPRPIWVDAVSNTISTARPSTPLSPADTAVVCDALEKECDGEVNPACRAFFIELPGYDYMVNTLRGSLTTARDIVEVLEVVTCLNAHARCLADNAEYMTNLSPLGKEYISACHMTTELMLATIQTCRVTRFADMYFMFDDKTPTLHTFYLNDDRSFIAKQMGVDDNSVGDVVAWREHSGIMVPLHGISLAEIASQKDRANSYRADRQAQRAHAQETAAAGIFSETLRSKMLTNVKQFADAIRSPRVAGELVSEVGVVVQDLTRTPDNVVDRIANTLAFTTANPCIMGMVNSLTTANIGSDSEVEAYGGIFATFIANTLTSHFSA